MVTTLKRRTKGCEQCRKRRVKCDETPEFCRQCLRLGLSCSGPVVGSVFVDMSGCSAQEPLKTANERRIAYHPKADPKISQFAKKQSCKKRNAASSQTTSTTRTSIDEDGSPIIATTQPALLLPSQSEELASFFAQKPIPMLRSCEVDPFFINEQIFLAQFMDLSGPGSKLLELYESPWCLSFPEQMSGPKVAAFRNSIRAASMSFQAFLRGDVEGKEGAFKLYLAGLQTYRQYLSSRPNALMSIKSPPPTIEEILIPLFLCMFEIVNCTTAAGCFQHLMAACQILHNGGPENFQSGIMHELFLSLRVSDTCVAIINGRASIFSSPTWRTTPFLTQPKPHPPFHDLMDILLQITNALVLSDDYQIPLCDLLISLPSFDQHARDLCERRCLELLDQLERWWVDFECCSDGEDWNSDVEGRRSSGVFSSAGPTKSMYTSEHTAFIISVYSACALILHTTLHGLLFSASFPSTTSPSSSSSPSPNNTSTILPPPPPPSPTNNTSPQTHLPLAFSHANTILLISAYQQESCLVGFNLIRSTFALKVVENMGPGEELRERAARMSLDWERKGLVGILAADFGTPDSDRATQMKSYKREELILHMNGGGMEISSSH